MKISFNWLKKYIDLEESPEEVAALLTGSGLEVEGIEPFETIRGGMEGIVIAEVISCKAHENADRLKITEVDAGQGHLLPIVCGAPNVASGQKVLVALPGTTLYPNSGEPFKIKKSKIRGAVSEGMICAEDEIGLGTSHDGIMVLDTQLPNGTPAAQFFDIKKDHILEIGLTPNRAEATSHIGVARDLKALLNREIKWPSVDDFIASEGYPTLSVEVENPEACIRYSGVVIKGIKVGPSPDWLQSRLKSIGLNPINNVVDITNFVLFELGQPLHAFDLDKIRGGKVVVKTLPEGTIFKTLDEKERKLKAEDLMICDDEEGMCIAGVFGGIDSGVKGTTENIFLESACFNPEYIRKTAQHHQLKTDASFRFERGTDPNITIYALKRASLLITRIAGGQVLGPIFDIYPYPIMPTSVITSYKHINRLIGIEIPKDEIHTILQQLDIEVCDKKEQGFTAKVPPYRVDVKREADVIEEILRIYGFDKIPLPDHVGASYLSSFPEKDADAIRFRATKFLAARGFKEIMTNSLTDATYAEKDPELNKGNSIKILNPLSEILGVLRQSMLYSGLEVIAHNLNRQQTNLKLFEIGKTYHLNEKGYLERQWLNLMMTGNTHEESWRKKSEPAAFHDLATQLYSLFKSFNLAWDSMEVSKESIFSYGLELSIDKNIIARLGAVKRSLVENFDIDQEIFYAELDWDLLLLGTSNNIVFSEVPRYPEVRRDLSLVIDKGTSFEELKKVAKRKEFSLIQNIGVFDVFEGAQLGEGKKAYALSFVLQDRGKTLTDKVIDATMDGLIKAYEKEFNALIRR